MRRMMRMGILGDEEQTFSHLPTSQNPKCLIQTQGLDRVHNQRDEDQTFEHDFLSFYHSYHEIPIIEQNHPETNRSSTKPLLLFDTVRVLRV